MLGLGLVNHLLDTPTVQNNQVWVQDMTQRALLQAIRLRRPKAGLIVHSDQGSQYTSVMLINSL